MSSPANESHTNGERPMADRIDAALQERAHKEQQGQFMAFVQTYGLNLLFPADVVSKNKGSSSNTQQQRSTVRTNHDLVNARLLENGILFEDLQSIPQLEMNVQRVVDNLMRTQSFNSVQIQIDKNINDVNGTTTGSQQHEQQYQQQQSSDNSTMSHQHKLKVILDEKNWYSLYIGGGIKHEGMEEAMNGGGGLSGLTNGSTGSLLPKAQFETRLALQNLSGFLDRTVLQYTIDQTSTAQLLTSYERPLYSWFPQESAIAQSILSTLKGSQYSLGVKAMVDTIDYESTRSYKEHVRLVQCKIDNVGGGIVRPEMAPTGGCMFAGDESSPPPEPYWCIDWTLGLRDIIPRRSPTLPYCADASYEVVAQSGPSLQHSIKWTWRTNGCYTDSKFQPTIGLDAHTSTELAGPPGDVGFAKVESGGSVHAPLVENLVSVHGSWSGGILKSLSFGGLCRSPTISDRFYVGGPLQLRGFLPAGIGPRSSTSGGPTSPGGDAIGGNLYYTATVAASFLPPNNTILSDYGVRLFTFINHGTLVGSLPTSVFRSTSGGGTSLSQIIQTGRTSAGVGVSAGTPMGRVELTYAIPIRYGPNDARRNLQFGFGFTYG